jgi:hypothetical protein
MKLTRYPKSALRGVQDMIAEGRKTGSLTLNFSQGSLSGMVVWRERENGDLTTMEKVEFNQSIAKANCR